MMVVPFVGTSPLVPTIGSTNTYPHKFVMELLQWHRLGEDELQSHRGRLNAPLLFYSGCDCGQKSVKKHILYSYCFVPKLTTFLNWVKFLHSIIHFTAQGIKAAFRLHPFEGQLQSILGHYAAIHYKIL